MEAVVEGDGLGGRIRRIEERQSDPAADPLRGRVGRGGHRHHPGQATFTCVVEDGLGCLGRVAVSPVGGVEVPADFRFAGGLQRQDREGVTVVGVSRFPHRVGG